MSKKAITHLIIDTSSSNEYYNAECDYVLVEMTPEYVAGLLEYMERVAQMHRVDKNFYRLELWDYRPLYFSYTEKFEALRDVSGHLATEVPQGEPILLDATPDFTMDALDRLKRDDCFQRVECQLVRITDDDVSWACYPKHTNVRIASATVVKKTLIEIQRRFGVREYRRPRDKTKAAYLALQRIHDLLYLDLKDGREVYDPDKCWDSETMSAIAEIVAEHIPRPKQPA